MRSIFLSRYPLVQDVGPHSVLDPLCDDGTLVQQQPVLEDEDGAGLGVDVQPVSVVVGVEGGCPSLAPFTCFRLGRGVVEVEVQRVVRLEMLAICVIAVRPVAVASEVSAQSEVLPPR